MAISIRQIKISFLYLPRIDKLRLVETMPKQNRRHKIDSDHIFGPPPQKNGFGTFSFKFFVPTRVGLINVNFVFALVVRVAISGETEYT